MGQIFHETRFWHYCPNPLYVGLGVGLFLPWALILQLNYHLQTAALMIFVIAMALIVLGGLGWAAQTMAKNNANAHGHTMPMSLFVLFDLFVVLGLWLGFDIAHVAVSPWPPVESPLDLLQVPVQWIVLMLLSSSAMFASQKFFIAQQHMRVFLALCVGLIALGTIFYAMMTLLNDLNSVGFTMVSHSFSAAVFAFVGLYLVHLVIAMLMLLTPLQVILKGQIRGVTLGAIAIYIHFVMLLGIALVVMMFGWA
ncbi:MAG: hypothetical protein HQM07_03100 [Zetaproteobacteria bacterium]|nr:hypothetical protein [Zetaproteobacteria bacterium]